MCLHCYLRSLSYRSRFSLCSKVILDFLSFSFTRTLDETVIPRIMLYKCRLFQSAFPESLLPFPPFWKGWIPIVAIYQVPVIRTAVGVAREQSCHCRHLEIKYISTDQGLTYSSGSTACLPNNISLSPDCSHCA